MGDEKSLPEEEPPHVGNEGGDIRVEEWQELLALLGEPEVANEEQPTEAAGEQEPLVMAAHIYSVVRRQDILRDITLQALDRSIRDGGWRDIQQLMGLAGNTAEEVDASFARRPRPILPAPHKEETAPVYQPDPTHRMKKRPRGRKYKTKKGEVSFLSI